MRTRTIILSLLAALFLLAAACDRSGPCPKGSRPAGEGPPKGREVWCQTHDKLGVKIKHGPTTQWWDAYTKKAEGAYVNDKRDGMWRHYDESGTLLKTVQYKDGLFHGPYTKYQRDGSPSKDGTYADGLRHGVWSSRLPDGTTVWTETFERGVRTAIDLTPLERHLIAEKACAPTAPGDAATGRQVWTQMHRMVPVADDPENKRGVYIVCICDADGRPICHEQ